MVATPTEKRLISQAYVKLDGANLGDDMMADLLRVRVDGSVHLPDLAILDFDNSDMKWSNPERIKIGQEIKVYFGDADLKSDEPVFTGEVTAIELDVGMGGSITMRIRCYDRAHRLHRGRHTRVFLQVKDSDIAVQIAGELGLQTDIQVTSGVEDWVLQNGQTNWEFLQERAARNGFELQVRDKSLVFKPPPSTERQPVTLRWNQELLSFRATMTTGDQVNRVEVRGWDPINKEVVIGTAERPKGLPKVGESRTGGEVAQSAFQKPTTMLLSRQPIYDQEQAQRLAQSVLDELAGSFITAQGVAMGDPRLQLGSKVTMESIGTQFSGEYSVTQISHNYEPEGYTINFEVTGRRSTDLVSLMAPPSTPAVHVMMGKVDSTRDPRDLGRVKVKLPVLGQDIVSDWCRVLSPGGGPDRGWQFLPEVDDEVLLIGDSMSNLCVLGGLWNSQDLPPSPNSEAAPSGQVNRRLIKSRTGHMILFEDSDDGGGITIVDGSGNNKMVIKTGDGSLTTQVNGDITFKSVGAIKLEAGTSLSIKALTNITQEATGNVSIEATGQATLKAAGSARVEGGASASLSGASVSLG
ncbi:MAG: VgrG-related protein [Dehalococcoidia bacterium]|nr:VgrG-related protein [Dehalococcoidia bacterium]